MHCGEVTQEFADTRYHRLSKQILSKFLQKFPSESVQRFHTNFLTYSLRNSFRNSPNNSLRDSVKSSFSDSLRHFSRILTENPEILWVIPEGILQKLAFLRNYFRDCKQIFQNSSRDTPRNLFRSSVENSSRKFLRHFFKEFPGIPRGILSRIFPWILSKTLPSGIPSKIASETPAGILLGDQLWFPKKLQQKFIQELHQEIFQGFSLEFFCRFP